MVLSFGQRMSFRWRMREDIGGQPGRHYHNWAHHVAVARNAFRIARLEGVKLTPREKDVLFAAAYSHDAVYAPGGKNNEEKSANLAGRVLREIGVADEEFIEEVKKTIVHGTKHFSDVKPETKLHAILRDADLYGLAAPYWRFNSDGEKLRREYGSPPKGKWSELRTGTLERLMAKNGGNVFYTGYGIRVLKERALRNLAILREKTKAKRI
ncbi:MAG: HD domain-containing protein [Candidatus Micrarchaeota archaeon]